MTEQKVELLAKKVRGIVFDLGGTLHQQFRTPNRDLLFVASLISELKRAGIRIKDSSEDLLARIDAGAAAYKQHAERELRELSAIDIWTRYFLKDDDIDEVKLAPLVESLSYLYDSSRKEIIPRSDLQRTIRGLQTKGYRIGLISNMMSQSFVPRKLAEYGILDAFDFILQSSAIGYRKPSPVPFQLAEKIWEMRPEQLCYIGDTLSRDVQGARNAGWQSVIRIENSLISCRDCEIVARTKGLEADYVIQNLSELLNLF